jgi:choline dehydrogenase-like flavoprotein
MDHPGLYVSGFLPGKQDIAWQDGAGGPKNILIPRFHNLQNVAHADFLRGYGFFGEIGRHRTARELKDVCDAGEVPLNLIGYGEMLPRSENRVTLQREKLDSCGIPTLRIDCAFTDNEHSMRRHMLASVEEMVHESRGRFSGTHHFERGGFVHEVGTARMGKSPRDSVLNGFAQCWDVPNVFAMDGAACPSGAWQNPTFTMMAIAGRACDHLATSLRSHGLTYAEGP